MKKGKLPSLQITEIFLVKADWNRTFMGQIIKETSADGQETFRGSVVINEGKAWSIGKTEEELGNYLDDICTLKLDYKLHDNKGKFKYVWFNTLKFAFDKTINMLFLN